MTKFLHLTGQLLAYPPYHYVPRVTMRLIADGLHYPIGILADADAQGCRAVQSSCRHFEYG